MDFFLEGNRKVSIRFRFSLQDLWTFIRLLADNRLWGYSLCS